MPTTTLEAPKQGFRFQPKQNHGKLRVQSALKKHQVQDLSKMAVQI